MCQVIIYEFIIINLEWFYMDTFVHDLLFILLIQLEIQILIHIIYNNIPSVCSRSRSICKSITLLYLGPTTPNWDPFSVFFYHDLEFDLFGDDTLMLMIAVRGTPWIITLILSRPALLGVTYHKRGRYKYFQACHWNPTLQDGKQGVRSHW